jgi:O-antigen ligase
MIEVVGIRFHIIEFFAIPFGLIIVPVLVFQNQKLRIRGKVFFETYLLSVTAFFISIVLSSYNALDSMAIFKSFFKWMEIFGVSFFAFLYCSSLKRFRHTWWLLCLALLLEIAFALIEAFKEMHAGFYLGLRQIPAYSTLFLLTLILPLSRKHSSVILACSFLVVLIVLSLSRGAWIGLLAIGVYWFWEAKSERKALIKIVLLILLIVLGCFLLSSPLRNTVYYRISKAFSLESASNRERLGMVTLALSLFLENPLMGIGSENFSQYLICEGIPPYITAKHPEKLTPHNFFLQVAAENGIAGLLATLTWLWVLYRILFHNTTISSIYCYISGLRLFFIALFVSLIFGYIAGGARIELGLYIGLVLGSLRVWPKSLRKG